ncbi:MAG: hypothetical protein QGH73_12300 [Rhodospirillales bacterium]|jgi:hypothetical protein|nr:hypothetical protein [Rhodospirillales bacterium]
MDHFAVGQRHQRRALIGRNVEAFVIPLIEHRRARAAVIAGLVAEKGFHLQAFGALRINRRNAGIEEAGAFLNLARHVRVQIALGGGRRRRLALWLAAALAHAFLDKGAALAPAEIEELPPLGGRQVLNDLAPGRAEAALRHRIGCRKCGGDKDRGQDTRCQTKQCPITHAAAFPVT